MLQKTPLSFDVSVWELFWPLHAPARGWCSPTPRRAPRRRRTCATLLDARAASPCCTSSRRCCGCLPRPRRASRRAPRCGWWSAAARRCRRRAAAGAFSARLPAASCYNLYGPTEAAIDVTAWHAAAPTGRARHVPIGRPIANTAALRARRARCSRCPSGVPGELYIGGAGWRAATCDRPGADRRALRPRPVRGRARRAAVPHRRPGALAAPTAALEFLGRIDHQVKMRGFRIELGEIEARAARSTRRCARPR